MNNKYCYIIEFGCVFEGGSVYGSSLDYDITRKHALKLVEKEQKFDDLTYGDEKDHELIPINNWIETKKNYWSNGLDFVSIKKMKFLE